MAKSGARRSMETYRSREGFPAARPELIQVAYAFLRYLSRGVSLLCQVVVAEIGDGDKLIRFPGKLTPVIAQIYQKVKYLTEIRYARHGATGTRRPEQRKQTAPSCGCAAGNCQGLVFNCKYLG